MLLKIYKKCLVYYWGVVKLANTLGFDPSIRRFESYRLSQLSEYSSAW